MSDAYVVAGIRPWSRRVFDLRLAKARGQWHFIGSAEELTMERLEPLAPAYVFFLHWSARVPVDIVTRYECVCFHMTDVPFGRGGSPLQNLVARGHRSTVLTALRMDEGIDTGPVYLKRPMSLEGVAEEVYIRTQELAADMIEAIIESRPQPTPQEGDVVTFRRRSAAESRVSGRRSLRELFDFVRMLDADGYPRAFIEQEGFRFELSRPALRDGRIVADVTITRAEPAAE